MEESEADIGVDIEANAEEAIVNPTLGNIALPSSDITSIPSISKKVANFHYNYIYQFFLTVNDITL
jgi:hypothetical protein